MTLAEQLTSVQTAISNIESTGQHIETGGRRLSYGDLKTLYDREERLQRKIAQADSGTRTVAEF